jgi:hypothetical protein
MATDPLFYGLPGEGESPTRPIPKGENLVVSQESENPGALLALWDALSNAGMANTIIRLGSHDLGYDQALRCIPNQSGRERCFRR